MEASPISHQITEDSGCFSGNFSRSVIFGSTPSTECVTPTLQITSRKRKYNDTFITAKRLQDVIESAPCTSSPLFSSTLNESLVDNLEKFHIRTSFPAETISHDTPKERCSVRKIPIPATPEKRVGYIDEVKKFKPEYFFNSKVNESPVKEAHDILYANLKPVVRKPYSPFRKETDKLLTPVKKCLFECQERLRVQKLFKQVVYNPVIMSVMCQYLSNGDIYRLSQVSSTLKDAILTNVRERKRYDVFMEGHKRNKENYLCTPPGSPEKCDSPPDSPPSVFNQYVKIGKLIGNHQSLTKCLRCDKPSIVENNIAQCQNLSACGYIYCQKCFSFSETGPEDFYDSCNSSVLLKNQSRSRLSDMSNSSMNRFNDEPSSIRFSILHSPRNSRMFEESSGFISETDYSPRQTSSVKRNLTQKLKSIRPKTQVFHQFNDVVRPTPPHKKRASLSIVPVVAVEKKEVEECYEPPSPPKVRILACSKQSKRNLKRLTR